MNNQPQNPQGSFGEDGVVIKTMAQDMKNASNQGPETSSVPAQPSAYPFTQNNEPKQFGSVSPSNQEPPVDLPGMTLPQTIGPNDNGPQFPGEPPQFTSTSGLPPIEESRKMPVWLLILIGVVIAAAIGGALYFFVLPKLISLNISPSPTPTPTPIQNTASTPTPSATTPGQLPSPIFTTQTEIIGINRNDYDQAGGQPFSAPQIMKTLNFAQDFTEVRILQDNRYLAPIVDQVVTLTSADHAQQLAFASELGNNWLLFHYKPKNVAGLIVEIKDPVATQAFMRAWELSGLQNSFDPLLLGTDKGTAISTIFQDGSYKNIANRYFRFSSDLNMNYAIVNNQWLVITFGKDAFFAAVDHLLPANK